MANLKELEKKKAALEKEIAAIEKEKSATSILSADEYKELRSLYDDVCEGVSETIKFKVEYEVTIKKYLNDSIPESSDDAGTKRDFRIIATTNNYLTNAIPEFLEEWDSPPFKISKKTDKIYQKKMDLLENTFNKIADTKGLDIEELYDLIPSYTSLREARKHNGK